MNGPVLILYLEDNPRDAELVRDKLQQTAVAHDLRIASDRAEYESALAQTRFDLILSDYSLPDYDGMTALALAREEQPDVPFILISGTLGEDRAVDCVVRGATDYVLKQSLNRLAPAVVRALAEAEEHRERRAAEKALRASEERFRGLFESTRDAILTLEPPSWRFTAGNPAAAKMFGAQSEEELISHGPWDLSPERQPDGRESAEKSKEVIDTALREGSRFFEWTHRRIGGEDFPADVLLTRMEQSGKVLLQASVRDITERNRAADALRESEERFRVLLESIETVAVQGYGLDGTVQYWNKGSERLYGYRQQEAIGGSLLDLIIPPQMRDAVAREMRSMAESGQPVPSGELLLMHKDGSRVPVISSHAMVRVPGRALELFCLDVDITERKQAEERVAGQLHELQRWYNVMLGREDRVIELKREVNELLAKAGEPARFPSAVAGNLSGTPDGSPPLMKTTQ